MQDKARTLLKQFKGDDYAFGLDVLKETGSYAAELGKTAMIVANASEWQQPVLEEVKDALRSRGVSLTPDAIIPGAAPNSPREDVYRIETCILHYRPDCLIAVGGGSTIDAVKAANVLASLGRHSPDIETYFGTNQVTTAIQETGGSLLPVVAVQTAASSAAHLTKYANVTDPVAGQKKLIVDESIVPPRAVFDYGTTVTMPAGLTMDGAFDGIAHCLEVFYGAGDDKFNQLAEICLLGIELAVRNVQKLIESPGDQDARVAMGLATDLGGYAIMVGGTNGGHLTSFSLVDVTSHGRACALMNPYYTVFFAPAIERQLRAVGDIYKRAGFITLDLDKLSGRELGIAVATAMIDLSKAIGFPTRLADLPGFSDAHIKRALTAAKNPQLDMKLRNMPVSLNASLVDEYMGCILEAAKTGNFNIIKNLQ